MSMCSIIGAGDDQATPASSSATYDTPQGGVVTPTSALSPVLPAPQLVVVALDAARDHRDEEIRMTIGGLVRRGDILRGGDSLLVLGVLHTITHPKEPIPLPGAALFIPTAVAAARPGRHPGAVAATRLGRRRGHRRRGHRLPVAVISKLHPITDFIFRQPSLVFFVQPCFISFGSSHLLATAYLSSAMICRGPVRAGQRWPHERLSLVGPCRWALHVELLVCGALIFFMCLRLGLHSARMD